MKEVREKEKKTRCQETHFEKIHHKSNCNESFGTEDHQSGSTLTLKETRPKEKGDNVGEHRQYDLAVGFESMTREAESLILGCLLSEGHSGQRKCINKGKRSKDSYLTPP